MSPPPTPRKSGDNDVLRIGTLHTQSWSFTQPSDESRVTFVRPGEITLLGHLIPGIAYAHSDLFLSSCVQEHDITASCGLDDRLLFFLGGGGWQMSFLRQRSLTAGVVLLLLFVSVGK